MLGLKREIIKKKGEGGRAERFRSEIEVEVGGVGGGCQQV